MSQKIRDGKGRWRNMTVSFRVSPEENKMINTCAQLSGLTKQEYLARRSQQKEVVVVGNPRVYKALKNQMQQILEELQRVEADTIVSSELVDTISLIANILDGLRQQPHKEDKAI